MDEKPPDILAFFLASSNSGYGRLKATKQLPEAPITDC
jgi:hypothetical protein